MEPVRRSQICERGEGGVSVDTVREAGARRGNGVRG